jgi:cytidylate kinase
MTNPVITIDGPVASGKGTIARRLAEALDFHLLDSGAIYRAHAHACLNRHIEANEINKLEAEAKALSLRFSGEEVWLDGVNATEAIRSETVGMAASTLSAIPQVRAALLQRQRDFSQPPGLVADGRDMGTIVFPDAALKIYLTTTASVRAERRAAQVAQLRLAAGETMAAKQLIEKGKSPTITGLLETIQAQVQPDVEAQIRQRDSQDKSREIAPLKPATDAIVIDNAAHSPDETVAAILRLWHLRLSLIQAG